MRIDQLPVASAIGNTDTLPFNNDGLSKQISVGNLTNSIRDNVYGAPLTASTSAGMTDTSRVYVYIGTTGGGFTNGHWYYYNGSAWTDGGIYNSIAVQTDPTLMLEGVPADAKATGELKTVIDDKLAEFDVAVETFYPYDGYSGPMVTVEGTVDAPLAELVIYGMSLQEGATPSPSAPVAIVTAGSGGTLSMVSVGKNLLDVAGFTKDAGSSIDRVDVKSGTIVVATPGGTYRGASNHSIALLPGVRYVCSGNIAGADGGVSRVAVRNASNTIKASTTTGATGAFSFTFTPTEPGWYVTVFASLGTSATGSVTYTGLQIEMATAATDFAPYNGITSAIPTPNGLPGVPVTSGGNYVDSGETRWICDTIDLEAGTWTKRCGIINSYNGEALPGVWLSSMDVYQSGATPTSGAKVVYALAAPEVVQLTTAQLTALRSLRGRKGLTNLYSADPAGPEIRAEMYIDIPTYIQSVIKKPLSLYDLNITPGTWNNIHPDFDPETEEYAVTLRKGNAATVNAVVIGTTVTVTFGTIGGARTYFTMRTSSSTVGDRKTYSCEINPYDAGVGGGLVMTVTEGDLSRRYYLSITSVE